MTTPSRSALPNDLGERAQIIIDGLGYTLKRFADGTPSLKIRPQSAVNPNATYISSDQYLTMRDYDRWSRVVVTDWSSGAGQITYDPSTKSNLSRFFDSTAADIGHEGYFTIAKAFESKYRGDTDSTYAPMTIAGQYLYLGASAAVKFSTTWSGAPSSAATSTANLVTCLDSDGQYVYAGVDGVGINRFAIGSTSAGTSWNTTSTAPRRILFANRKIYAASTTNFYEVAIASAVGDPKFTPPTGWDIRDIAPLRGGAIDAPILILAGHTSGRRGFVWYWDGVSIHDYMPLPTGFNPSRMKVYLGVVYITGSEAAASGEGVLPRVYSIVNGTLTSVGYIPCIPQAWGDDAMWSDIDPSATFAYPLDFRGTEGFFVVPISSSVGHTQSPFGFQVWRYDIVRGGFSRLSNQTYTGSLPNTLVSSMPIGDLVASGPGGTLAAPWFSLGAAAGVTNNALFGPAAGNTFTATATLDSSDLNLGQPWATNLWAKLELTFAPLRAGEAIAIAYSSDDGGTYTSTDVNGATMSTTTTGAKDATWLISNTSSAATSPYIRIRTTLTAGTSQLTAPQFFAISLKAVPMQPAGIVLETWLACPDASLMPNGQADWQGACGSQRIQKVIDSYTSQTPVSVIYMATNTTRAKNPTTIACLVDDYEVFEYSSVGYRPGGGPPLGIEGDVRVVLRQII